MHRRLAYGLLLRQLRRTFRRIVWLGSWAPPPTDRPVVLFSNHHAFYDAQILGFFTERVLRRHTSVWMEELDRFPFLAALGAAPFPADDAARRVRTIRRTARLMNARPETALIYFPEAHLHPIEEGILPFPEDRVERLADVFPNACFWPVALQISGWHEATPTASLTGGAWRDRPDGRERAELAELLQRFDRGTELESRVLLEGVPGPNERWDFSPLGRRILR